MTWITFGLGMLLGVLLGALAVSLGISWHATRALTAAAALLVREREANQAPVRSSATWPIAGRES